LREKATGDRGSKPMVSTRLSRVRQQIQAFRAQRFAKTLL
jgi:hypothetical protein